MCNYDYFEKHYSSYLQSKANQNYDVTFVINAEFFNAILVKNLKKEFLDIKEQYYSHIIRELLGLIASEKLTKYIINVNSQDLLCCMRISDIIRGYAELLLCSAANK